VSLDWTKKRRWFTKSKTRGLSTFVYAAAEIASPKDKFYDSSENIAAMNSAVVHELRRAMICQDAPKWAKDMRPFTQWRGTNVLDPGQYPWHWEPPTGKRGAGIDWSKVEERDLP